MILSRLVPPGPDIDLRLPDAAARIDELYSSPEGDWLRINLIVGADGNAAGPDGTSESLTGGADRKILGAIRRASDVVLIGASSVRTEGYQLPRHAPLAILTGSGDLKGHALAADADSGRLIVLCPESAVGRAQSSLGAARARFILLPAESGTISPAVAIDALRDAGFRSIVCEGGPSLAGQLVDAGLVDELCLTTSPLGGGRHLPVFGASRIDPGGFGLTQRLADDAGYLYERWDLSGVSRARA